MAKNNGSIEVQSEGLGKGTLFLFSMKVDSFDSESGEVDESQSRLEMDNSTTPL